MTYLFIGKTNSLGGFDVLHELSWVIVEDFDNLIKHRPFKLSETSATDILAMSDLTPRDQLLLSAAAGAAVQFLIDHDECEKFRSLELAFEKDPD